MNAQELVRLHLANVGNPSHPEVYATDIIFEFPYASKHHTGRLEGRDAVVRYLGRVGEFFTGYTIPDPKFTAAADPETVIVEYACEATNNDTNRFYAQDYVAFATVKDGVITHIREYYDPVRVLVAFGEIEEPGS